MKLIDFGKVKKIILFGGSRLLAETAKALSKMNEYEVIVFSSSRHLNEAVDENNSLLKDVLRKSEIEFFNEHNINSSKTIDKYIDENTLGIAMGASWIFEKKFVKKFHKPLLDFMGIDLPRYRGGAHYTWQILFNSRNGCCNLQVIIDGSDTFQKGPVIKRKTYSYSDACRLPIDYFNYSVPIERDFIIEFLKEIKKEKKFKPLKLKEEESTYYPFLHTLTNGWVDWSWTAEEIERFICAFDDPYNGASTRINGKRVFIKKAFFEKPDKNIHPYSAGLVIHNGKGFIKVLAKGGILRIEEVCDGKKKDILKKAKLGDRFYTPKKDMEKALTLRAEYGAEGLKK